MFSLLFAVVFCYPYLCDLVAAFPVGHFSAVKNKRNTAKTRLVLPERIIVGYANWEECDKNIVDAVKDGVNVVIWFQINLSVNETTGLPAVTGGPDMDCVADIINLLSRMNLPTIHLISAGGWDSPHPDTSNPPEATYAEWDRWNREDAARPEKGFYGFDGIDWDIEGNDNVTSPFNLFTVECLDLIGRFSQLAKRDGYFVSMAPAESYIDPTTSDFSRSLLHTYPEYVEIGNNFYYHGRNCYSYLLSRYSESSISSSDAREGVDTVPTFDFITVQLYEGYSHALFNISYATEKQSAPSYLQSFVRRMSAGWNVDFSKDADLGWPSNSVSIPPQRLVIGLANGWAGDGKFLLIYPKEIEIAYNALLSDGINLRGFAFWDIADEGKMSTKRPNIPVYMAAGLNSFLHIR